MNWRIRALGLCLGAVLLVPAAGAQTTSSPDNKGQVQSTQSDTKDTAKKEHKTHVRLDGVTVGVGYAHFSGNPFFGPFWPYGFYPYGFGYSVLFVDPFYGPLFYPGYFANVGYGPDKGEVKLSTEPRNAAVYIDGAYAGTADHLKHIWLDSGAYDLSVSAPGRTAFTQRIYVLSGKSLKIKAKLDPTKKEETR
jgi:PEGA domain-containing protein